MSRPDPEQIRRVLADHLTAHTAEHELPAILFLSPVEGMGCALVQPDYPLTPDLWRQDAAGTVEALADWMSVLPSLDSRRTGPRRRAWGVALRYHATEVSPAADAFGLNTEPVRIRGIIAVDTDGGRYGYDQRPGQAVPRWFEPVAQIPLSRALTRLAATLPQ